MCPDIGAVRRDVDRQISEDPNPEAPGVPVQGVPLPREDKLKIGLKASAIDKAARDSMKDHNQYFTHGLGHGVGMDIHEKPSLDPESKDILKENMVFTIEPGAYIPDYGGVRIEDMVLLTKKGKQVLTKFPRRL